MYLPNDVVQASIVLTKVLGWSVMRYDEACHQETSTTTIDWHLGVTVMYEELAGIYGSL